MNILGNPVGNLSPRANFNQTDSQKADYIDGRETLIATIANAESAAKTYADSLHFTTKVFIPVAGWTSTAPYTATIQNVEGILASDTPHYSVVYSSDAETRLREKEAFAMIDDLETGKNKLTFTCFEEKPEVLLNIQLEVNR